MARGLAHRPGPAVIVFVLATGKAADDRYAQLTPARLPEAAAPPEVFWGARDAITADPDGTAPARRARWRNPAGHGRHSNPRHPKAGQRETARRGRTTVDPRCGITATPTPGSMARQPAPAAFTTQRGDTVGAPPGSGTYFLHEARTTDVPRF